MHVIQRAFVAVVLFTCVLVVLALTVGQAPAKNNDFVITRDLGGDIYEYIDRAKRIKAEGRRVVIDGECYSACMVYIVRSIGNEYCVTNRAVLGFHQVMALNADGTISTDPERIQEAQYLTAVFAYDLPMAFQFRWAGKDIPWGYDNLLKVYGPEVAPLCPDY